MLHSWGVRRLEGGQCAGRGAARTARVISAAPWPHLVALAATNRRRFGKAFDELEPHERQQVGGSIGGSLTGGQVRLPSPVGARTPRRMDGCNRPPCCSHSLALRSPPHPSLSPATQLAHPEMAPPPPEVWRVCGGRGSAWGSMHWEGWGHAS